MKTLSLLCLLSAIAFGQQAPATMLKMVVSYEGPSAVKDPYLGKPRTMYRASDKYCRTDELPNPVKNMQEITIVNEPNSWVVNELKKTGKHFVDKGPVFDCRMPMLVRQINGAEDKNPLIEFEYGREMDYFKHKGITSTPGPVLRDKQTLQYTTQIRDSEVFLYTIGTPERPWAVVRQHGKDRETYWYDYFEEVPFDARLFVMPDDIKFKEVH